VLVLIAVLSPIIPPRFFDRISTLTDVLPSSNTLQTQTEVSFRGRSSEAIVATQMFRDYPVLGVGHGNYRNMYLEYSSRLGIDARFENRQAHSLYLEIIAETGILGIVVFLIMLAVLFINLQRAKHLLIEMRRSSLNTWVNGIQYGFVAYLLASFFLHGDYIRYFWLIVGFVSASSVMAEEMYRNHTEAKTLVSSGSLASNFE
jgi:O-antigen ligase